MQEVRQRLNKAAFTNALKVRNITQADLAEKIGANEKSFSRWINEGYIQSKYVWDMTEELNLEEQELDEILMLPKFKVFFRIKYLGDIPTEIESRAIELAKTLFGLTYLNSGARFCPPNASKVEDALEVANQIRKYTSIESFNNLHGIISNLAEQGVETAVVPFDKLGLTSDGEYELAFSVTDEKRCLIFLDASAPEELLIFNLCHELGHLFRPDHGFSVLEEKFCNAIATELVYPKSFFETHRDAIGKVIASGSSESIVNLLNVIRDNLGGEPFGVSLRLKSLGFLSQKDRTHQKIISFAEASFKELPKIGTRLFQYFNQSNRAHFRQFWSGTELSTNSLLRFFLHIKNGAINGTVSARKFSELFHVDIGTADEMIHSWKRDLHQHLKEA